MHELLQPLSMAAAFDACYHVLHSAMYVLFAKHCVTILTPI